MELNNKRVLVVGLGKSGVASALFLKARGARVTVSDTKSGDQLRNEIPVLLDHGITVETGGHGERTFRGQDLIVVSPGVPVDAPPLVQARALGEPVIGEIELAAQFLPGPIVAITGSNGKTTTTTLAGEIIAAADSRRWSAATSALRRSRWPSAPSLTPSSSSKFELSAGDDSDIPSEGCGRSERHSRPSRPSSHVRGLRRRQGAHLREPAGGRFRRPECRRSHLRCDWARERARKSSGSAARRKWSRAHASATARSSSAMRTGQREIMLVSEIPLKGAHNVENVLAAVCAGALMGCAPEKIRQGGARLQSGRAPAGIRRHDPRRRLLQRFQGHQRRCDDQGAGIVSRRIST